jgi:site-specific recombinase XerD
VSLPCDFHSFRRAFCTGIAASGVNVQMAMSLAGHSSAATHQRYVQLSEALSVPDAAIPTVSLTAKSTTG